jgi:hypothetical protein
VTVGEGPTSMLVGPPRYLLVLYIKEIKENKKTKRKKIKTNLQSHS